MSKSKLIVLILIIFICRAATFAQEVVAANKIVVKKTVARAILRQAKAAALQIRNDFQRDAVLDPIGAAQARAGELDAAINTANQTKLPPMDTLDEIGKQLANTKDLNRARVLGEKLKSGGFNTILSVLVKAQIRKGDLAQALRSAELIKSAEIRSYALTSIAEFKVASGDYAGGQTTYTLAAQAYPAGRKPQDDFKRLVLISKLSRGEIAAARVEIANLKEPDEKFFILIAWVDALGKKRDYPEAIKWLEEALKILPNEPEYEFLRYFAIPYQVKVGRITDAMLAAGALTSQLRLKGYMAVAITCAETRDIACVNAAVEQMNLSVQPGRGPENFGLKLMMLNVTAALIENGQAPQAERFLTALEPRSGDVSGELGIEPQLQLQRVLMLAGEHKFAAARSLAFRMRPDSITDVQRGIALRVTSLLQTKMDGSTATLRWAGALVDAEDRAYALLGVAQAFLDIGDVNLRYNAIQVH